ncbi:MAG: restriction endonuclease, partial [Rhodospirillaceae bacterium]|nr:restriction endonuclease [Rhodospirillaceae bacterium]
MQDSIAPSGDPTVFVCIPELPEAVVEAHPVETRVPELPCDQLSWQGFERLVFRLVRKNSDVVYCARYGRSGQAQHGIDVYARLAGGRHVCWQAKNRKDVRVSDIKEAVDDFLKGKWAATADRFILCVRASLADTALQNTIETQAARLLEKGIVFESVDGTQLSEKLRSHPDIVDDFFGRSWLVAFVGEEVAAGLKRPLEVQRVIAL